MKRFFLLFFLLTSGLIFSQDSKHSDQIKSLKIAHLTTVLDLTPTEAEKFWSLYNTYDQKMYDLRHNAVAKFIFRTEIDKISEMSEKEADKILDDILNFEAEVYSVKNKFIVDAQKIISSKKIIKLKIAENNFNKKLLKQYKKRK